MSLAEKLRIWAWIIGVFLILAGSFHYLTARNQAASLDSLVERWKTDFHLTEDQARRLRRMEEEFHGDGDPFLRPGHNPAETSAHHAAMAEQISAEERQRFLRSVSGGQ